MAAPAHVPVMADRVVDLLAPALTDPGATLLDATLGLGGHAGAVLRRCPQARVVGLDRDPDALAVAAERLREHGDRVRTVHAVYDEIPEVLAGLGLDTVDAVLFDLGVSSLQLDHAERGFAYREDAPLDMRMDTTTTTTAADVLNTYTVAQLTRVLREHGDEKFAPRIARAVVREREREPFSTSARLVALLYETIPAPARRRGGHPAKRTFQALRMEVNDETGALRRALPQALAALRTGGRIVVEAYHSGEDRIVKRVLADATSSTAPQDLPVVPPGYEPEFRALVRGAEQPGPAEVEENPRAAPVRLRAAERTRPAAGEVTP